MDTVELSLVINGLCIKNKMCAFYIGIMPDHNFERIILGVLLKIDSRISVRDWTSSGSYCYAI